MGAQLRAIEEATVVRVEAREQVAHPLPLFEARQLVEMRVHHDCELREIHLKTGQDSA